VEATAETVVSAAAVVSTPAVVSTTVVAGCVVVLSTLEDVLALPHAASSRSPAVVARMERCMVVN
jgi:hypothetical protein